MEFTIRQIEALPSPTTGRAEYKDTKEQGLYLRVTSNGVKSFSFVGRAKGSNRVERLTLGKFPQVKPEEARDRARKMAGKLASGISVAKAERERRGEMTVGELWDLYYAKIEKSNKSPQSTKINWELYVKPTWGNYRLSDVAAVDVERWHLDLPEAILKRREAARLAHEARKAAERREVAARQAIRRRGPDPKPKPEAPANVSKKVTGRACANKGLEVLRAMYNFALDPKRAYFSGRNPASNHAALPVQERERFLRPSEMAPFFDALASEPNETMRDAILIGLLTGQRRANVLSMRWQEVDFELAQWSISGELMKNGRPHICPLTEEAFLLLKRRFDARETNAVYVFPAQRKGKKEHIGSVISAWRRVMKHSGITDLIVHDLRRTLGSWQARNGTSLLIIGKGLNHRTPEATAIYARLDMDPVRESMGAATTEMFRAAKPKKTATIHELPTPAKKA